MNHHQLIRHLFAGSNFAQELSYRGTGQDDIIAKKFNKLSKTPTAEIFRTESAIWLYANWCGPCKDFADTWESFNPKKGSKYAVDCAVNSKMGEAFNIRGFPTVLFSNGDGTFSHFTGNRTVEDLKEAMEDSKSKHRTPHAVDYGMLNKIL